MAPDINVNVTTGGDTTGGDKVTTGDISGEGISVGRGASATGSVHSYMSDIWAEAMRLIRDIDRRLTQLEIRLEMQRERDTHDGKAYSPGGIIIVGGIIALALISLLLWLALSGYPQ
jgi:hypothetical protein